MYLKNTWFSYYFLIVTKQQQQQQRQQIKEIKKQLLSMWSNILIIELFWTLN
jgi:hypothetical protein